MQCTPPRTLTSKKPCHLEKQSKKFPTVVVKASCAATAMEQNDAKQRNIPAIKHNSNATRGVIAKYLATTNDSSNDNVTVFANFFQ
jgi:hypothetical protein